MNNNELLELMKYIRGEVSVNQGRLDRSGLINTVKKGYKKEKGIELSSLDTAMAIAEAEKRQAIILEDPHLGHDIQTKESGKRYSLGPGNIEQEAENVNLQLLAEQAGFESNANSEVSLTKLIQGAQNYFFYCSPGSGVFVFTYEDQSDPSTALYFTRGYRRIAAEGLDLSQAEPHFSGEVAVRAMQKHISDRALKTRKKSDKSRSRWR